MHTQCISVEMIKMFHHCSLNKDYRNFYEIYERDIKESAEDLRRVNIENSHRCRFITGNLLMIFKFLRDYSFTNARKVVPGCYELETADPELIADIKFSIDSKNWNPFYKKYSKIADFIIDQAYAQQVLDLSIEWNEKFYTSFEAIENAKLSQNRPFVSKNSGEMLTLRPGPSPYLSTRLQCSRNSSPNRSTEVTPNREARNKYSPNLNNHSPGSFLQTENHSKTNGVSANNTQRTGKTNELPILIPLTLSQSAHSPSAYNPENDNKSFRASRNSQAGICTISHGNTETRSEVRYSFGPLHFDYTNSQQPNHVDRSLQSSPYKGGPTSYGAPVANPENTGILDCCRSASSTTRDPEYNTTSQRNQGSGRATATNLDFPVVTRQPAAISNDHPPTCKPLVPPHRTNDDRFKSNRPDGNQNVDYSSQSQPTRTSISSTMTEEKGSTRANHETHTGQSLQNREESHFHQQIDVLLDKGYQSPQYQKSSTRPSDQIESQEFKSAQSKSYDNGFVQSSSWGRDGHEPRQESFSKMKDHAAITASKPFREQGTFFNATMKPPVSPKNEDVLQSPSPQSGIDLTQERTHSQVTNQNLEPVAADKFHPIGPYSRTHGGVSLGPEVVVDYQTESFKTTQSSNQELSQSHEQARPEIRDNTSEAEKPAEPTSTLAAKTVASLEMHQETYGGCTLQPESIVPSQISNTGNFQSDDKVLSQSESPSQPPSDFSDRPRWQEAEPSTTHSEPNGGIPLHPLEEGVGRQTWSPENVHSSYHILSPSEAQDQSLPGSNDISVRSENWETTEPETLQNDFSMLNDSGDMDTLKQHDDSFENLENDTAKPGNEEENKQSSEELEVVDDHRSSLGSINIEFSPIEDSVISHQSCFDLDDLRRTNDTPVESIDGNFDDELLKHQAEMSQVNRDVGRTEHLITKELENMQRQQTIIPNNPDLMKEEDDNSDFNRQLEEMKRQQAEELRRIREERKRKQKLLDEELQKMRKESKDRFRMFMTCIILKQRFEQQEDKWKDWIRDCKNNIVALQKYFLIFEETYRRVFTGSKKKQPDFDDLEDFESEKGNFSRYLMNTYNALETDFETLQNIEQHYNDAMFLRILQKCIADVAKMVLEISDTTFSLNSDSFSKLDEQMSKLHIDLIYSTTKLRSVCSQADVWQYQNVHFPKIEQNLNIEETNYNSEETY